MKKLIFSAALVGLGAIAFANHIPVALSFVAGPEVLNKIVLRLEVGDTGVPPYVIAYEEAQPSFDLTDGSHFSVRDHTGTTQTVTFNAASFRDISNATMDEVVSSMNSQLSIAVTSEDNGHLVMHGMAGGVSSTLTLIDGAGLPLDALKVAETTIAGQKNVQLEISIPGDHHTHGDGGFAHHEGGESFAGHSYVLVASATEGTTLIGDVEVPLVADAWTFAFLEATNAGLLPGFVNTLDAEGDSQAFIPTALLPRSNMPEELYFSYIVLNEDETTIDYVSNRFTIEIDG